MMVTRRELLSNPKSHHVKLPLSNHESMFCNRLSQVQAHEFQNLIVVECLADRARSGKTKKFGRSMAATDAFNPSHVSICPVQYPPTPCLPASLSSGYVLHNGSSQPCFPLRSAAMNPPPGGTENCSRFLKHLPTPPTAPPRPSSSTHRRLRPTSITHL